MRLEMAMKLSKASSNMGNNTNYLSENAYRNTVHVLSW
jgi:hypothetical protein